MARIVTHLQLRGRTAAEWATNAFTVFEDELALERDTGRFKFGDGVTRYTLLPYATAGSPFDGGVSGVYFADSYPVGGGYQQAAFGSTASPDALGFNAQVPCADFALPPGIYTVFAFANINDFKDATNIAVSLVCATTGDSTNPGQTGRVQLGAVPRAWDDIDLSMMLYVLPGEVGDVTVVVNDDSTGDPPDASIGLTFRRIVDLS